MRPLEVTARSENGRAVVRLRGELDIATADTLRRGLRDARRDHGDDLVLDLSDLEFMDSGGLSVIVACYKAAAAAGGGVALAAPRPVIRRALEITGLHRRMPVHGTLREALAATPDGDGEPAGSGAAARGAAGSPDGGGAPNTRGAAHPDPA
ncbi:STAS domain-containing protein [Actinomadura rifamycini]|uniref:STAS domain-containing protein n=1 Tax=Actinomadura rifamycini TaxID=31962 RepID=UPI0004244AAB|nr:STAS domain-containing protein [Actinomadura rifamycini]